MNDAQHDDSTDPVHILWTIAVVLLLAAVVFFIVSAVAFHPSDLLEDPDTDKGYITLIAGVLFTLGGVVPMAAALMTRALTRARRRVRS